MTQHTGGGALLMETIFIKWLQTIKALKAGIFCNLVAISTGSFF